MNTAQKGARAERRTIAVLEAAGYTCVRSAASKGLFDVVAWNGVHWRVIQVKAGKENLSGIEREQIQLHAMPGNATKECWRWPSMGLTAVPLIEVL